MIEHCKRRLEMILLILLYLFFLQERFHYTHTLQCLICGTGIIAFIQKVIHHFLYHEFLKFFRNIQSICMRI